MEATMARPTAVASGTRARLSRRGRAQCGRGRAAGIRCRRPSVPRLREPNHTDAFWSLVAENDAEYKDHAEWLKEHSVQLIFSADDL